MKSYTINAYFPQALAHKAYQKTIVDANGIALAAKRGLDELRKVDGVKGKHITVVKLTIVENKV